LSLLAEGRGFSMRILDLDALLGDRYPEATFHDSQLEAVALDFLDRSARLDFAIPIEDEGRGVVYRSGTLELRGLRAFAAEMPRTLYGSEPPASLWITADGPSSDPAARPALESPSGLPGEAFCHYLFAANTNSYIVFAATEARFLWRGREGAP
jgi:hypothetical protein